MQELGCTPGRSLAFAMTLQLCPVVPPTPAVFGKWVGTEKQLTIPDPLNGEPFIKVPDTQLNEIEPFVKSLLAVPKSGLHNPFKNPER